mmetsp:Transcript_36229/g.90410  ORF Transcript_36229/g.90410 Transcript_36229/m.90410 type:complete len:494 (-) Transcript_36229:610-2091(-)
MCVCQSVLDGRVLLGGQPLLVVLLEFLDESVSVDFAGLDLSACGHVVELHQLGRRHSYRVAVASCDGLNVVSLDVVSDELSLVEVALHVQLVEAAAVPGVPQRLAEDHRPEERNVRKRHVLATHVLCRDTSLLVCDVPVLNAGVVAALVPWERDTVTSSPEVVGAVTSLHERVADDGSVSAVDLHTLDKLVARRRNTGSENNGIALDVPLAVLQLNTLHHAILIQIVFVDDGRSVEVEFVLVEDVLEDLTHLLAQHTLKRHVLHSDKGDLGPLLGEGARHLHPDKRCANHTHFLSGHGVLLDAGGMVGSSEDEDVLGLVTWNRDATGLSARTAQHLIVFHGRSVVEVECAVLGVQLGHRRLELALDLQLIHEVGLSELDVVDVGVEVLGQHRAVIWRELLLGDEHDAARESLLPECLHGGHGCRAAANHRIHGLVVGVTLRYRRLNRLLHVLGERGDNAAVLDLDGVCGDGRERGAVDTCARLEVKLGIVPWA